MNTVHDQNPYPPLGRVGKLAYTISFVTFLTIVGIVGAMRETEQFPQILVSLTLYLATLLVPIYLLRTDAGWFHPLIFTSGLSFLHAIRRAKSYTDGMQEHGGIPGHSSADLNDLIWQLLLIQVAAQIAYYLGYLGGPTGDNRIRFSTKNDPAVPLITVISLVGIAFFIFLRSKGGLTDHMLDLGKGRVRQIEENQIFGISAVVVNIGMLMSLVLLAVAKTSLHWLMVALTLPIVLFMKYATAGSRSAMVYSMILCLIVVSLRGRKVRWSLYISGAVAAIVAMGALGQIRRGTWKGSDGLDEALASITAVDAFGQGVDELESRGAALNPVYAIMARVPQEVPYLMGESYLTLVTAPIPRAIWPAKPRSTGAIVGQTFFDSDAGMPPGPIGEALWNFGITGVLAVYLLFGAFHKYLATWYKTSSHNPVAIALFAHTLWILQPDVLMITSWMQTILIGYLTLRLIGVVRVAKPR